MQNTNFPELKRATKYYTVDYNKQISFPINLIFVIKLMMHNKTHIRLLKMSWKLSRIIEFDRVIN